MPKSKSVLKALFKLPVAGRGKLVRLCVILSIDLNYDVQNKSAGRKIYVILKALQKLGGENRVSYFSL